MLTREENELLCRVGPGTPMGEFMRQFWVPALRSQRLEADGAPVRVQLLSQNLVAFRATDGRVGVFDEGCPHRCTSMALARNEDNALTCIFHGWKIDVSGKVVDVPSEPPERRAEFAAKVRVAHYPVREAAGIVWVWLGKGEQPAEFPNYNWINLPPGHTRVRIGLVNSNWLQGLEGQLDSAHVGILHQDWINPRSTTPVGRRMGNVGYDTSPRFEFEMQPYGYREAAVRNMPDGSHYVRVREYVMPWFSYIPHGGRDIDQNVTISVPVDDEHSAQWDVNYNLERPLAQAPAGVGFDQPDNYATHIGNFDNHFNQNRKSMKEGSWSGFSSVRHEDFAVAVAQGIVCDRTREYLGTSDSSIIRARRLLLESVRRFMKGDPVFKQPIDWNVIRALDEVIPADADWRALQR
jgi:phthalate 4,5-dioxygenase oxygenase subunit